MREPKVKMGSIDFVLFTTIMTLLAIGVVMVFSASSYYAMHSPKTNYDTFYFLKKQGLWAFISITGMFITIKLDYHRLKKLILPVMLITIVLLIIVLFCPAVNGATRWIPLGFASIQPSEIAKYVVVLYMAKSIENKGENIKSFCYGVLPYFMVSGFYAGMVLLEKNLSIAAVIMIVTIIMVFVGGVKGKHIVALIGSVGLLGVFFILVEPYRLKRLMSFRNPWADARGDGYQLIQSLLALGSGGIWGMSLGQSRQKCYYIPEPHNDFIFSVIGEELGLIGCTLIIIVFLIFIWRGIRIAINAKDTFGTLLAIGITAVIAIQAIINIAVVTGSMPVTGVPLPFISYGGSSLLINMVAMGVLLNISRQIDI